MAAVPDNDIDFSKTLAGSDPIGPLSKLLWECREIHESDNGEHVDPLVRMFMSQNAASTAWHMTDWVWKRCPPDRVDVLLAAVNCQGNTFADFANAVREANIDVAICRQLATAGKHVTVSRAEMKSLSVEVEHNDDNNETIVWVVMDGHRIKDNDIYARVLRWWIDLYIHVGFPEAQPLSEALDKAMRS